jgi:hypothetical protein
MTAFRQNDSESCTAKPERNHHNTTPPEREFV